MKSFIITTVYHLMCPSRSPLCIFPTKHPFLRRIIQLVSCCFKHHEYLPFWLNPNVFVRGRRLQCYMIFFISLLQQRAENMGSLPEQPPQNPLPRGHPATSALGTLEMGHKAFRDHTDNLSVSPWLHASWGQIGGVSLTELWGVNNTVCIKGLM